MPHTYSSSRHCCRLVLQKNCPHEPNPKPRKPSYHRNKPKPCSPTSRAPVPVLPRTSSTNRHCCPLVLRRIGPACAALHSTQIPPGGSAACHCDGRHAAPDGTTHTEVEVSGFVQSLTACAYVSLTQLRLRLECSCLAETCLHTPHGLELTTCDKERNSNICKATTGTPSSLHVHLKCRNATQSQSADCLQ